MGRADDIALRSAAIIAIAVATLFYLKDVVFAALIGISDPSAIDLAFNPITYPQIILAALLMVIWSALALGTMSAVDKLLD